MSEIDQVHLRAVMLFMLETSEIIIIFELTVPDLYLFDPAVMSITVMSDLLY